jgi:hypothetical protein
MKIKLPRKRKKAFIKARGWGDYMAVTIINEILCEDENCNKNRSYYDLKIKNHFELIYLKKW